MKIKITCRPRYNPWLKKYLNTKTFSKMLVLGVLINSVPINSFAGMLSDDGRYETFKGSNITINDVLEEDKVDVEIEGNTLVNSLNYNSVNDFSSLEGELTDDGYIEIETDGLSFKNFFIKKDAVTLKPSTEYTFFVDIAENTLTKCSEDAYYTFIFGGNNDVAQCAPWDGYKMFTEDTPVGIYKFTLTTKANFDNVVVGDRGYINKGYSGKLKFRYMIVEGNHIDEDIDYFKGMKSVGQDDEHSYKIDITSNNKNLLDYTKIVQGVHTYGTIGEVPIYSKNQTLRCTLKPEDAIPIEPNVKISIYSEKFNVVIGELKNGLTNGDSNWRSNKHTIITKPDTTHLVVQVSKKDTTPITPEEIENGDIIVYYGDEDCKNIVHQSNKVEIPLNEPLRALPNGIKDRIIKRNGQWVVERNCKEVILDGSKDERWGLGNAGVNITGSKTISFQRPFDNIEYKDVNNINIISDRFPSYTHAYSNNITEDKEWIRHYSNTSTNVGIRILKSKLSSETIEGFEEWLSNNPLTVVYELQEPIYEPLNIDSIINTYLDVTHISNNSTIPANLKVTVDRTINRATEAVELAKINPTRENLSLARMWTNLLRESIKKDELQSELNNNIDVVDLQLERKTASANLDVYIKCENILMMNLSTNSITFDDFSGVEDMVKENAVNISINSSLPYNLNAYLATDIQNSDKSSTMNKDILSIKENNEIDYQTFSSINDKVVLKSNCNSGNDKQHDIDLKLNGGIAHEKDVYKTTIKFEAEQQ